MKSRLTDQEMIEKYGVVLTEADEAPPLTEIMLRIMKAARRQRMEQIIQDGRYDPEEYGLRGRAGFMGRGTFEGDDREAGYLR